MQLDVTPDRVQVLPGVDTMVVVQVRNTSDVICAYTVRVLGLDPRWTTVDGGKLSLFPDGVGVATVRVMLPDSLPAGTRRLGVEVTSELDGTSRLAEIELAVPAVERATVRANPVSVTAGQTATVALLVGNDGNRLIDTPIQPTDPENKVEFDFEPARFTVAPGEEVTLQARATARRPIFGQAKVRVLTFVVPVGDPPPQATVTFIQRPLISRGLLAFMGLLAAVSVFAVVLTDSLSKVVDVSRVDDELLLRAIEGPDARTGPANPASITGTVTSLTSGAGIDGVTVELFAADSAEQTVRTTSTDQSGGYTIPRLEPGAYKVRFRGAQFSALWYPAARDFADGTEITLEGGESRGGVDARLGGVPGSIAGRVIGDEPVGSTLLLLTPAAAIGAPTDSIVTSTAVDATGAFRLDDVPSPSTYIIEVTKPGFSTTRQEVRLGAGQNIDGIEILLSKGDGSIAGRVFSSDGPIGGVTVTTTDGANTVATVSLTEGDVGAFFLRGLPTPGSYTVSFTREGFATATLSLNLAPAQELSGISATLARGDGSIAGHVNVVGRGATGNVTVTVTNGEDTFVTASLTEGDVGLWFVTGLPVPSTYTVTFSGAGLANQTRSVDVDPLTGANVTGVDATLTRASGSISGKVELLATDQSRSPAGGASITAAGGGLTFTTRAATVATDLAVVGHYVLPDVPPGTYTITFSYPGRAAVTTLRTLAAGQDLVDVDGLLEPLGSITVMACEDVVDLTPPGPGPEDECFNPRNGYTVRLYLRETYPQDPRFRVTGAGGGSGQGEAIFTELFGPEDYIIEVYAPSGSIPVTPSTQVFLAPGDNIRVLVDVDQ